MEYTGGHEFAGYNLTEFEYTGCNSSGFSARMGGERYDFSSFEWIGEMGFWYGADANGIWILHLEFYVEEAIGPGLWPGTGAGYGMSVRCIKD